MNNFDLRHGDCFRILEQFSDKSIDLVVTDPPYLHNKGGGKTNGTEGKSKIANSKMYNFGSDMMKNLSSFHEKEVYLLLDEFKRLMPKLNAYIFTNDTLIPYYTMWAVKNKKLFTILTWEKPLSILNRNRFSQNLEYIVRVYDKKTGLNKLDIDSFPEKKNYYSKNRKMNGIKGDGKLHPTQKPIEYLNGLIELSSNEGAVVLDPFMGSGSTGVACKNLNRNFIGIEKDEKFFKIAKERIGGASAVPKKEQSSMEDLFE